MPQTIKKTAPGTFTLVWTEAGQTPGEPPMSIDFKPLTQLIQQVLGHSEPFALLHWQAKPIGLRRWGIYDSKSDNYIGADWQHICLTEVPKTLQLNEQIVTTKPTAVLWFPGCSAIESGGFITIKKI